VRVDGQETRNSQISSSSSCSKEEEKGSHIMSNSYEGWLETVLQVGKDGERRTSIGQME